MATPPVTSGVQDIPTTVRDLCSAALLKINVYDPAEQAQVQDAETALRVLRGMVRTWAADGVHLWGEEELSIPLQAGVAQITISPEPLALIRCYRSINGYRSPLRTVTREQYSRLPNQADPGTPYWIYLDRQRSTTIANLYPVPNIPLVIAEGLVTSGIVLLPTIQRTLDDTVSLNDALDIPPEWNECVIYNLAARLCDDYAKVGQVAERVAQRAGQLYETLCGQDREASVFIRKSPRWRR